MPDPVTGAAIASGVAQIGGSLISGNAAARAARGQQKSSAAAIRIERDREAKQWTAYDAAVQRRNALQDALLSHYGINLPRAGGAAPAPAPSLLPAPSTPAPGPAVSAPAAAAPAVPTLTGQPAAKPVPSIMPEGYGLVAPPPEPEAPPSWSSWGRPR